jgi:thiosulfate/3-mercaptopyruvate sulfurtransferase
VPGARGSTGRGDLRDPVRRDVPSDEQIAELLGRHGVTPDSTVVLYGDR